MKARVLFVDDEPAIRSAIEVYLDIRGYEVDLAGDLEGAVSLLMTRHYDAVITDLRLSGSGTEGLQIIRLARERLPNVKSILLTGRSPAEHEALTHGADRCVQKPIPLGELDRMLRTLLTPAVASD